MNLCRGRDCRRLTPLPSTRPRATSGRGSCRSGRAAAASTPGSRTSSVAGCATPTACYAKAPPANITVFEAGRALVIGESWAFVLRELGPNTTRLIVRGRGAYKPGFKGFLGWRVVFEPAHFIMERKIMLTIKRLAELGAAAGAAAPPSEVRAASEELAAAAPPAA